MKKYFNILCVLVFLFLLIFTYCTLRNMQDLTTEHNTVVQRADSLEAIAANLRQQNDSIGIYLVALQADNEAKADSLSHYINQIGIVTAENDSIKKAINLIPPDTIYQLMQDVVPDSLPKIYPFSGQQTTFYYSEYIDNIGNKKLLKSHETALYGCMDYSKGLASEINLLNDRNSNTEKQLVLADIQTELFKKYSENLNSKFKISRKKQKYFTIGIGVAFVLGVIAAK